MNDIDFDRMYFFAKNEGGGKQTDLVLVCGAK
jgi:hypothetical protein